MSEMSEKSPCLKKPRLNWKLLPIKLHYFFFYGALGGVLPYLPLLGKSLGINATAVGIVYAILPFTILFSKPLFGAIVDHFSNLKIIMVTLVFICTTSYTLILLVPQLPKASSIPMHCLNNYVTLTLPISASDKKCDNFLTANSFACSFRKVNSSSSCSLTASSFSMDLIGRMAFFSNNRTNGEESCICSSLDLSSAECNPQLLECLGFEHDNVYMRYEFWLYALFTIIGGTCSATAFCLSDAACTEILGDDLEYYGRQRLWATVSWGFVSLLTGHLNDIASEGADGKDFTSGFYIMIALVLIDLMVLYRIEITKADFTTSIFKDVGRIFTSLETVAFAVGVLIVGALTGLLWQYQFWYLEDLGANQLLLGLTVAVQCLVAEVPFFFASGKIIKLFGHFNCLILTFLAFAVRYCLFYFLKNPWWVLPIEIFHGQSYGVFYATMTSYASSKAPPGTEATMLGVLGGLFEGLGAAVGNLLSGVGFDTINGRNTFLTASGISFFCTIVYVSIKCRLSTKKPTVTDS